MIIAMPFRFGIIAVTASSHQLQLSSLQNFGFQVCKDRLQQQQQKCSLTNTYNLCPILKIEMVKNALP